MNNTITIKKSIPISYFGTMLVFILCSDLFDLYGISNSNIVSMASYAISLIILFQFASTAWVYHGVKGNWTYYLSALMYLYLLVITLLFRGSMIRAVGKMMPIISISAYTIMQCRTSEKKRIFIKSLADMFFLLAIINLFSILLFPKGIDGTLTYFIGMKNHIGYSLCVGYMIIYIDALYTQRTKRIILYSIISVVSLFLVFSRASLIGFGIIILATTIYPIKNFVKNRSLLFCGLLVSLGIISVILFSDIVLNIPFIKNLIENVLHKDITLGSRTDIWKMALVNIAESPLLGHGVRDSYNLFEMRTINGLQLFSSHNQYLQTLFEGGLVALALVVATIVTTNHYTKDKNRTDLACECKIVVVALLVLLIAEAAEWRSLIFILNLFTVLSINDNDNLFKENLKWRIRYQR